MSKQTWEITGDCIYEETCDNGVVPKPRVICYMHPDTTAKDRYVIVNAPQMHAQLKECSNFFKRFFSVLVETDNMDAIVEMLDKFKEFDGLATRISEVLEE